MDETGKWSKDVVEALQIVHKIPSHYRYIGVIRGQLLWTHCDSTITLHPDTGECVEDHMCCTEFGHSFVEQHWPPSPYVEE